MKNVNPELMHYFEALPAYVQMEIVESGVKVNSAEELMRLAEGLLQKRQEKRGK